MHGLVCVLILILVLVAAFAPGPVQAEVGVVFFLPNRRMSVAEEQLEAGVAKFVVTADVDESGGTGLRSGQSLGTVVESFSSERHLLAEIALHQPSGKGEIAISGSVSKHGLACAAIGGPGA